MFADVTSLRYWKTERADLTTCEDALRADTQQGVFCVADGAGSTLFSNIWADILVDQYQQNPLLSSDPFEMEWWIRQAQKLYRNRAPQSENLKWNARQKALEQGAYSTLAALHFNRVDAQAAQADAIAIGDSCILVGNLQKRQVTSFPLHHTQDFDRAPYCVPSLLRNLNRYAIYPKTQSFSLSPDEIVVLATDSVARWIISGGGSGNESDSWQAFFEVAQKTEPDWQEFIDDCRANRSMLDDDSTVIIIHLREDGQGLAFLGTPSWPGTETLAKRVAEFEQAQKEDNKEMLAISYGDGQMLNSANIVLSNEEVVKARKVADALRDILQAMRGAVNTPNFKSKLESIWWEYADLLMDEPCSETLRKNLIEQGVRLKRPDKVQTAGYPAHDTPEDSPKAPPQVASPVQPQPSNSPGTHIAIPDISKHPPRAVLFGKTYHLPLGNDPEQTRILRRSEIAPALQQDDNVTSLESFRELLARGEPYAIAEAYHPSFETSLSEEEQLRLQAVLHDVDHLFTVFNEGAPLEKIRAYETLRQPPFEGDNLKQLELAREFVQAMNSGNDNQIFAAYSKLEFSPLRKYFTFSQVDQQRINQARKGWETTERFRMLLHSGASTPALILQAYQYILVPGKTLSVDENYIVVLLQRFTKAYQSSQQSLQMKDQQQLELFIRLYYAIYFSPYKITCTWDEMRQVIAARSYVRPLDPFIVMVNDVPINLSHALALLNVKRRYARSRLTYYRQQRPKESLDQKVNQDLIAIWQKKLEQRDWPATIINELVDWRLLQLKVQEEINAGNSRRGNTDLKKDLHKNFEELAQELRANKDPQLENNEIARDFQAAGNEFRSCINQLTEQNFRQAQESIALTRLVERYLLEMSKDITVSNWLEELRNRTSIHYSEFPESGSSLSPDQQRCWLFRWWVIKDRKHVAN